MPLILGPLGVRDGCVGATGCGIGGRTAGGDDRPDTRPSDQFGLQRSLGCLSHE
jgi:hypothetical protein